MTTGAAGTGSAGAAVTVVVDYHYFCLQPADALPVPYRDQSPGLAQVAGSGPSLIIFTGLRSGPVRLRVTSGEPLDPASGWTVRQQVALDVQEPLYVTAPDVPNSHLLEPLFTPQRPGPHTVTVLARDRTEGGDVMAELDADPVEQYLVVFTPAA